jgi:hypothetical protein
VASGRSWAAAKNDADAAELNAKLAAAKARLAVADEVFAILSMAFPESPPLCRHEARPTRQLPNA